MKCIHCGAKWVREHNMIQFYACDSNYCEVFKNQWMRSPTCMLAEIDELKRKLKKFTKKAAFTTR